MKISIEEIENQQEEEIIIRCHEVNEEILRLLRRIKVKDKMLIGFHEDSIHQIKFSDVYYFESVDNKVFIYCKTQVYESKQKLYELEELCEGSKFFRASKSSIINIAKISYIKPSISGRFEARMDNGESVMVSRQYVPVLKTMLGI
ncbi:LytTR family DNA-binding domain-containing protein [Paenibacillus sp.]|jgi:DNA-binding LytR/AlgR family response regulator|uniref:LytTR family DNA-binding domain-containing protein n=1 Tax=Paenibacillus sp. TaxID=58172 RepID=UPI002830FD66|nr:LytTR family DNA-binding domain-containing protein [Paenibacillus sp.]MDR0267211.1 LytTR family transcriptional regulator DNA-binding domain-containing protein [Paenibacillus sp.]